MRQKIALKFKQQIDIKLQPEYQQATKFYENKKFRLSNEFYKRSLQILENNNQLYTPCHINLLLAQNQIQLKRHQKGEMYLEKAINIIQNNIKNDEMLYQEYQNLLIHCLKTNINKAIILSKALDQSNLPEKQKSIFQFYLGTAHLVKGNYESAKREFRNCLTLEPFGKQRGFIYNNLAVACWWHKYPNSREMDSKNDEHEEQRTFTPEEINQDYETSINLFKQSIKQVENDTYDQLLNLDVIIPKEIQKYDPSIKMLLKHKESGIPLLNLGEYLINCRPELKNEATFWFKYQLKFFEINDPQNIQRTLITLAQLCSASQEYVKAEGLFKKALSMMENDESYNMVLALQLYGNMLKKMPLRQKEGETYLAESFYLEEQMPEGSNRIIHLSLPEFNF